MTTPHSINYYYSEILKVLSIRENVPNVKALTWIVPRNSDFCFCFMPATKTHVLTGSITLLENVNMYEKSDNKS